MERPQMQLVSFDVERDVKKARADRERREAEGLELTSAELRDRGAVPISDRATVLIEHAIKSHVIASADTSEVAGLTALSCVRRLIEYVSALEHAAFGQFAREDASDTPRGLFGMGASAMEQIADVYEARAHEDPTIAEGIKGWRAVAARLRVMEQRIDRIPGETPAPPVQLPAVRVPGSAPGS